MGARFSLVAHTLNRCDSALACPNLACCTTYLAPMCQRRSLLARDLRLTYFLPRASVLLSAPVSAMWSPAMARKMDRHRCSGQVLPISCPPASSPFPFPCFLPPLPIVCPLPVPCFCPSPGSFQNPAPDVAKASIHPAPAPFRGFAYFHPFLREACCKILHLAFSPPPPLSPPPPPTTNNVSVLVLHLHTRHYFLISFLFFFFRHLHQVA